MVYLVAKHVGFEPRSLTNGRDAGQNTRCHFGRDQHLSVVVKHPDGVTVLNPACVGINRVNPDLLRAGLLQDVDVAIAGVRARFIVEPGELQRVRFADRVIPTVKTGRIGGQRMDYLILLQFPGIGESGQSRRVNFNFP